MNNFFNQFPFVPAQLLSRRREGVQETGGQLHIYGIPMRQGPLYPSQWTCKAADVRRGPCRVLNPNCSALSQYLHWLHLKWTNMNCDLQCAWKLAVSSCSAPVALSYKDKLRNACGVLTFIRTRDFRNKQWHNPALTICNSLRLEDRLYILKSMMIPFPKLYKQFCAQKWTCGEQFR
jgi:hypothetical protein